jgi:hypothetical protein
MTDDGEIMNLGHYASYPLPKNIRDAFGVETAQQLADQLGVTGEVSPALSREADAAYRSFRGGDTAPARSFMTDRLGMTEAAADEALAKLSAL